MTSGARDFAQGSCELVGCAIILVVRQPLGGLKVPLLGRGAAQLNSRSLSLSATLTRSPIE